MALLGLGCGVIISSMTTKYRDLHHLVGFGVQLWMYATPVVYTIDMVPARFKAAYLCNPMAIVIESFRNMFFGTSVITPYDIALSWGITLIIALGGILLFNRVEKTFMDTV
jgi:lipopolysaccharide transport system permease protein